MSGCLYICLFNSLFVSLFVCLFVYLLVLFFLFFLFKHYVRVHLYIHHSFFFYFLKFFFSQLSIFHLLSSLRSQMYAILPILNSIRKEVNEYDEVGWSSSKYVKKKHALHYCILHESQRSRVTLDFHVIRISNNFHFFRILLTKIMFWRRIDSLFLKLSIRIEKCSPYWKHFTEI